MVKKKTPTALDLRTNTMRAHAMSRALTALLASTAEQAQSGMPDIVEAVKALRTIADVHLDTDEREAGSPNDVSSDESKARWIRGLARGALKRMGVGYKS